jgi:hypothetical protein
LKVVETRRGHVFKTTCDASGGIVRRGGLPLLCL